MDQRQREIYGKRQFYRQEPYGKQRPCERGEPYEKQERHGKLGSGGQITVFLSLILTVLISFLSVALYSARTAGSRYLFLAASEAAAKSMFAAYDTRVWEQYRILMLTDETLCGQLAEECRAAYGGNGSLFPVTIATVEMTEEERFADNGAAAWEEGAVSYMENRLPVEMVSWLWEQSGLASGLEDMKRWITGFKDLLEPLTQLEKQLCSLEKQLSEAVAAFEQGKQLAQSIGNSAQALSGLLAEEAGEEEIEAAWNALQETFGQLSQYTQGRQDSVSRLLNKASEQLQAAGRLKQQIEELRDSLGGDGESPGSAIMTGIGEYIVSLTERADFLERLPEELAGQRAFLEQLGGIGLPSLDTVLSETGQAALAGLGEAAAGLSGTEWSLPQMGMSEGSEEDEAGLRELLDLKEWLDKGILWLTLGDGGVSEASLAEGLTRTEREQSAGLVNQAYRNLLYGEYALRYTADYTEEGGAGLRYETEYLIAGQDNDRANLATVAGELLLLRGAANLAFLLSDETKRTEARALAVGISLALGGLVPATLISGLLMVLWALAEAVCDARGLFAGGRVPFWKTASDWRLSWDNILSLFGGDFLKSFDKEQGMAYADYLRLFLFLTPLQEKCFRTMEIAQENLRTQRSSLQIGQAINRAVVVVSGQAGGTDCRARVGYGY